MLNKLHPKADWNEDNCHNQLPVVPVLPDFNFFLFIKSINSTRFYAIMTITRNILPH